MLKIFKSVYYCEYFCFFEPTRILLIHVRLVASSVHQYHCSSTALKCLKGKSKGIASR